MALVITNRIATTFGSAGAGHGTGVATTGAFTPNNSSLLVVRAGMVEETDAGARGTSLTIADSLGGSWGAARIATSAVGGAWSYGEAWWARAIATGSSMTVGIDCGASNVRGYRVEIWDITGYHTTTPVGGVTPAAVTTTPGNTPFSTVLSSKPLLSSIILASVTIIESALDAGVVQKGASFQELFQAGIDGWVQWQSQMQRGTTSELVDWVDLHTGTATTGAVVAGLEIRDAAGDPPLGATFLGLIPRRTRYAI